VRVRPIWHGIGLKMTINGKQIRILTEMVVFHFKVLPGLPPVTRVHKNGRSQYSLGFEDGIYLSIESNCTS
jgi:hypothetical protein